MRKIMIIDDSQTIRRLISLVLKRKNYITIEAEDGLDAIEKLATNPVDLIIVDLNMPNMDGIEFVRIVRNNYYYMDVPIIMFTTTKDEQIKRDALRAGVNLFLNKPINFEVLLYKVEGLIEGGEHAK
ncbi:MAG: response regulator [Deltaproteobacteria bacterium]|nr:response regulator [Deltaproteobacteria bacterium]